MEMNKIIEKINYFTKLSRERELTLDEKKRENYLEKCIWNNLELK